MADRRRHLGRQGEEYAVDFLRRQGYLIAGRNVRLAQGEIDIVARQGEVLCLVEVRTRRSPRYGTPEESLTARKRQRLRALAEEYLAGLPEPPLACRIDLVAIEVGSDGSVRRCTLLRNVVEGHGFSL